MILLLSILLSCGQTPGPEQDPTPIATPADKAAAFRAVVQLAKDKLDAGEHDAAREALARAYREHFEPLEPALRGRDSVGTTRLEYRFGQVDEALSRGEGADQLMELADELDSRVVELPVGE